jgi:hypothetical protein
LWPRRWTRVDTTTRAKWVRASLLALEREEQAYEARLATLRGALEEGEVSGDAEDYSLEGLIVELDAEKA